MFLFVFCAVYSDVTFYFGPVSLSSARKVSHRLSLAFCCTDSTVNCQLLRKSHTKMLAFFTFAGV